MRKNAKTHGDCLPAIRAFKESDPLMRGFTIEMLAQSALFVAGVFVALFALKGWVVTWM